jgi:hypothetical protein
MVAELFLVRQASFEAQLKIWREAAVKPTVPESAREHQASE